MFTFSPFFEPHKTAQVLIGKRQKKQRKKKKMDEAAVGLNQTGTDFLDQGDLDNALLKFREALSSAVAHLESQKAEELPPRPVNHDAMMTRSSAQDFPRTDQQGADAAMRGVVDPSFAVHRDRSSLYRDGNHRFLLAQAVSTTTGAHAGGVMAATPFVHARCLPIIATTVGAYSDYAMNNASCVSAILIFNLGVVYHIKAMQGGMGSNSRNWLTKARALYKHSATLLTEAHWCYCGALVESNAANPVLDLLGMALFNNPSHHCYELFRRLQIEHKYECERDLSNKLHVLCRNYWPDDKRFDESL